MSDLLNPTWDDITENTRPGIRLPNQNGDMYPNEMMMEAAGAVTGDGAFHHRETRTIHEMIEEYANDMADRVRQEEDERFLRMIAEDTVFDPNLNP